MPSSASHIPSITITQDLAEGVDIALACLQESLAPGVSRDCARGALLEFVRSAGVTEIIDLALAGQIRTQLRRAISPADAGLRRAIAKALWSAIYYRVRPTPNTAYEVAVLAETVAANMIADGPRVAVITDRSDEMSKARVAEIEAVGAPGYDRLDVRSDADQDGIQEAMCEGLLGLEVSTVDLLGAADLEECPAEPEAHLYLEDLDTWFALLMSRYLKRARMNARFGWCRNRVVSQIDELADEPPTDEGEDDDGGVDPTVWEPPPGGGPGGGVLAVSPVSQEREDVRIQAVRDLVDTAEKMLHGKQRTALLTKLFSPKRRDVRRALLLICATVLSEIPREIASDEELARLIGSPSGSAAQRNYNHARAKLLTYAKDAEQRQYWQLILDALLPRRSRNANSNGDNQ